VLIGLALVWAARPGAAADSASDERRERVLAEVRELVAGYHARLPRDRAIAVGAAYARYSTRFQDSVLDQLRAIFEDALLKKVFVPLEHVFFDLAVRGCKSDRAGLNGLRECLKCRAATVAFFFATNRLFRKTYRALQFVEEGVIDVGARAVFVRSGVDTADGKRWRALMNVHAMMDEFVVGAAADHVRAAHEGLLERRLVFGTVSFGYTGRPVPGQATRRGRPRTELIVDPVSGPWVVRAFEWYVADGLSVRAIVRRLNADPDAPPPPKAGARRWSYGAVRRLLANPRYRGCWPYGVTETVWVSSKDYARQVRRAAPLKEVQIEALRLVPDDRWYAARARLARECARAAGRAPRATGAARPAALNGLFVCAAHGRRLHVGGTEGRYMVCPECQQLPADARPLFTQLRRATALRATCSALADLLRGDPDLVARVGDACRRCAAEAQAPDPARRAALEGRLGKLDRQIAFVLANGGDSDADRAESAVALRALRAERGAARAEFDALEAAAARTVTVPDADQIAALVADTARALAAAADGASGDSDDARAVIDRLTGGRIDVEQAGARTRGAGWLRGRFRCPLVPALAARFGAGADASCSEVTVEYRTEPTELDPARAAEVAELYRAGALVKDIAARVGLARSTVARLIRADCAARGEPWQDGRSRRARLAEKHTVAPLFQTIADRVKELADGGAPFGAVAEALEIDRNTVTAAWRHWHTARGLPVPDGRARRKQLRLAAETNAPPNAAPRSDPVESS